MNAAAIIPHNPGTVWPVPEQFRPIYSHAAELRGGERVLFISGQFGVALDGSLATEFEPQCAQAMTISARSGGCGASAGPPTRRRRSQPSWWQASPGPNI
jgi:hypothetical protein